MKSLASRVRPAAVLAIWTFFVWTSRLRNVWTDETLSTGGQVLRTGFALVFVAFAVLTAVEVWTHRGRPLSVRGQAILAAFVVWSIGFWLVRGIGIIVDDHTASFTAIHTVLMVVSISMALYGAQERKQRSISSSAVPAH